MYTRDAIIYFSPSETDHRGAKKKITELLELSSGAVSQWGDIVPEGQAYKLESLTDGKLRVDKTLYRRSSMSA